VLLRTESCEAVEVLQVEGAVEDRDVDRLVLALDDAMRRELRGVVVDLARALGLVPAAVDALRRAASRAGGWPRTSLAVCAPPAEVRRQLSEPVPPSESALRSKPAPLSEPVQLHADATEALQHVDDRSPAPRTVVALEYGPQAPAQAREAVRAWTEQLGSGEPAGDLLLVVSELVTNAVRYAAPPVLLELQEAPEGVTVAVVDGTPGRPMPTHPDPESEGGRGLLLVDLLAAERGVRPAPPGKAVWAALPRP